MALSFKQTISFLYVIIVHFTCVPSLISNDEECLALFQFKQTVVHQQYASKFDIGGFHKFASWRKIPSNATEDDSDCCFWDGVMCSSEGHVIGLDLSQSSLHGSIMSNSTLFNLVHLRILNLSMNDFVESQIPAEIAHLKQLRILDLYDSGFNGQIPSELSQLVQLSTLNLSRNSLKLGSTGTLEYLLANMTRLEELRLSGVDVSSSVPHFLANFSSLRLISLGDCQLQDEFPWAIFHLPKLQILNLQYNTDLTGFLPEFHNTTLLKSLNLFTTGFGGTIPESIGKLNHLVFLALDNSSFSGHIPRSLSNLTQLTTLGLSYNELTGVVPSLESLSKLDVLVLNNNNFDQGRLFDWLTKLTKLQKLYVQYMNIYDEIPPSIGNLTKLSLVFMRGNFIFGQIPSSFSNLTTLTDLDLALNQLQGPIPSAFSNLKSLVHLNLGANKFKGMVDPNMFVGLTKLEFLELGGSRISFSDSNNYTYGILSKLKWLGLQSCDLKEFPAFLRYQKKLVYLFLSDNTIGGLIPTWIWNNSQETLNMIDLSSNFITGFHEHPHFLSWFNLKVIFINNNQLQGRLPIPPRTTIIYDVSYNYLTQEIPPSICEVKSLQFLDLSSNHMIGNLPPCLGNLSNSLSVLNLKQNNFRGPMMNTFAHGNQLKSIDLSENLFTGQVTKTLANCANLQFISLGDNSFDGLFPFWLGNLSNLQVLILRSNKFYGEIQGLLSASSQFFNLRILDLSNNNFSGQLPGSSFRNWKAMKSTYFGKLSAMGFNISYDFRLTLPDIVVHPTMYPYSMTLTNKGVKREYEKILNIFTVIDLSCNNFVGEIPETLEDLQGLESLNLSNNYLTGRILPSLGNLKNLESLDLSKNELSGEIPQELLQLGYLAIFNVSFNHLDGRIPRGKQFNTFDYISYVGNPGLCGQPLSDECESSKTTPPPTRSENESLLPSEIMDWIIILFGIGSGLTIGIIFGNIMYTRCSNWFVERFGLRKDRWVRPLRNKRRN